VHAASRRSRWAGGVPDGFVRRRLGGEHNGRKDQERDREEREEESEEVAP